MENILFEMRDENMIENMALKDIYAGIYTGNDKSSCTCVGKIYKMCQIMKEKL